MFEDQYTWISMLELEWSRPDGFLAMVREGKYEPVAAQRFIKRLSEIKLQSQQPIAPRLVALLWYVPLFLTWQRERVKESGGDVSAFQKTANQILNLVQDVLGVP